MTMEIPCAIRKNPGKLSHTPDEIKWASSRDGAAEAVQLSDVQGMQATPPTAAKLRIKLSAKDGGSLMLEFTSAADLENARNGLQAAIKAYRDRSAAPPQAGKGATASPAETPTNGAASAGGTTPTTPSGGALGHVSTKRSTKTLSLEPGKLLQNLDLQMNVLRQDPELMKTFQQVVIASNALTNDQFWSLRMHLLVAAAQQQLQVRGSYNVLSTIKPTVGSDNRVNINLTREKIADLFDQYPLVRKAYNDNVPKLAEGEFWQRFFMSKLFLVLRGEKVAPNHPVDIIFDPYIDLLTELQEKQRTKRSIEDAEHPAPLFINVEANAENNPETYGNDIITTSGKGTRSLIRSMNNLSHRLLLGKRKQREAAEALQSAGPGEMSSELRLNDLSAESSRAPEVDLHLQLADAEAANANAQKLARLAHELSSQCLNSVSLDTALDSITMGSSAEDIIDTLTQKRQTDSNSRENVVSSEVQLTQATSVEFLRHFWKAYSRSPGEAATLREFLVKSKDRVNALQDGSKDCLASLNESLDRALAMPI